MCPFSFKLFGTVVLLVVSEGNIFNVVYYLACGIVAENLHAYNS